MSKNNQYFEVRKACIINIDSDDRIAINMVAPKSRSPPSGDVLCPASGDVETVDPLNGVIHVYDAIANLLVRGSSVRRRRLPVSFLTRLRECLPTSHIIVVATLTVVNFHPPVRDRNVDGARYPRLVDE